jgi:hypothetical protein
VNLMIWEGFSQSACPHSDMTSGLMKTAYMLVRVEGFGKALQAKGDVPRHSESLVLFVQLDEVDVSVADDIAAPLLDGHVIIAPIERVQMCASSETKLEAHLRVAPEVAVLFAVVGHGSAGSPIGPDSSIASITNSI